MNRTILRNLNDILNAPKLETQNTTLCFDWKDYPIDDEEKTQEVDDNILEDMTKRELKNLAQNLKDNCLEFDYDCGALLFDFEKYVVVALADEETTYYGYDFDDWAKNTVSIIIYEKEENENIKKTMGLCKGRHDIPQVTEYIYPNELNPLDINTMDKIAGDQLKDIKELDLYVTGLTVALISVVNKCLENDIKLTLYHFDRDSGTYYPQPVNIFNYQNGYDDGYRDGQQDFYSF